jgi:phage baseplate assembly protein V
MSAELLRKLGNIAAVGTISEVVEAKALVRVTLLDRVTDFLPVLMFANSFKKHFVPLRVGEQVIVVSPYGEASSGFVIRGIFNRGCREPELANDTTEVIEFEDGTVVMYDTKAKHLFMNAVGDITIKAAGNIKLEAGGNIDIDCARLDLN